MRVAVTGTACVGKSTFIQHFLKNWEGVYKTPKTSYRDIVIKDNLQHSKHTTKNTQQLILDCMIDDSMKYTRDDNIIFDRCAVDNIAYSMHSYDKQSSDIDSEFIDKCIPILRECMKFIDILFYIPFDNSVEITDNGSRETDIEYIKEIDNIIQQIEQQSLLPESNLFDKENRPAIISLSGSPLERITQASLYITDTGAPYSEKDCDIDWNELSQFGIEPTDVFPGGKL